MFLFGIVLVLMMVSSPLNGKIDKHVVQPHYNIAICEQYGVMNFVRDTKGKVVGYNGPMWEIFLWVSQKFHFQYTLVHSHVRLDPFPNGTWGGMIGLLETKVDIVFTAVAMASNIFRVADFTATVSEDPAVALLPVPVEENRALATIKPFSLTVWLFLLGTFFALTFSLFILRQTETTLHLESGRTTTLQELALANMKLFLGQGGFEGHAYRPLAQRLTLAGWMLAVLVVVNSYTGCYISYATAPRLVPLAETLQDLAYRTDLQPLTMSGLQNQTGDPAMKILGERIKKDPSSVVPTNGYDLMNRVSSGCCFFLFPRIVLEWALYNDLKQTGRCRCSISKTPIMWDYYVVATQKGTSLTTEFSKEILFLKEVGLIQHWLKTGTGKRPYKCLVPEPSTIRPLTLKDLSGAFAILVAGIALSVVAFVAEVFNVKSYGRKKFMFKTGCSGK